LLAIDRRSIDSEPAVAESFYEARITSQQMRMSVLSSRYRALVNAEIALTILLALSFYVLYTHHIMDTSPAGTALVVAWGLLILGIPAEWLRRTAATLNVQRRICAYYKSRLKRMQGAWQGAGDSGSDFLTAEDSLSRDLDLFGAGSLFEYLCSARTGAGRRWLATALREPSPVPKISLRQEAVAELRGDHELRESLAATSPNEIAPFEGGALTEWLEQSQPNIPSAVITATLLLALINLAATLFALAGRISPEVPLSALLLVGIVTVVLHRKLKLNAVIASANPMVVYELELLQRYRHPLGAKSYQAELLKDNTTRLRSFGDNELRRLIRAMKLMRLHQDPTFTYLSFLSLWGVLWAMAIENARTRCRASLKAASEALGEIEGLCSFAAFSFEHPAFPFPRFLDSPENGVPLFMATGMTHPLLHSSVSVANPANIDSSTRFVLVSGSNMSGKSTYLRSVGLNYILARAGAPVCCAALDMNCFTLVTSMRVHDSLQDGKSRFMAEVTRVREIVDVSASRPILFLLDELLSGTNSEDRRAGIAGLITKLLASGASGFLTMHDLALVELVVSRPQMAKNVHFLDQLSGADLAFDYRLRNGIVPHSNGTVLLKALGIL
jgi:hypothetical protein